MTEVELIDEEPDTAPAPSQPSQQQGAAQRYALDVAKVLASKEANRLWRREHVGDELHPLQEAIEELEKDYLEHAKELHGGFTAKLTARREESA